MTVVRVLLFLLGLTVVIAVIGSAVQTVLIPRGIPARISRFVFLTMRGLFRLRARPGLSYAKRDRVMALYAPVSLLVLLTVWIALVLGGYTLMYWAVGERPLREAFELSGSSITTLGFDHPDTLIESVLAVTEATLGLVLLALMITYLPSIYGVFSRREHLVAGMEVRGGSPPSATEILSRAWRVDGLSKINVLWRRAEQWFLEIQETHMSFPSVVFFRSPEPDHSWVTAAGAILDSASMLLSTVDLPRDPNAAYCIRAGYLALRRIATFFRIPFDPDPTEETPISISRDEFDDACEAMAAQGVPLVEDLDAAWRDFRGWRVNYDRVLVALAGLTMAPPAPWSSDRSIRDWRPRASLRELRRGAD